jgi:hypothetical protein
MPVGLWHTVLSATLWENRSKKTAHVTADVLGQIDNSRFEPAVGPCRPWSRAAPASPRLKHVFCRRRGQSSSIRSVRIDVR